MRFLGVGTSCDLSSLYRRLVQGGHDVRIHVAEPMCHDVLAGIVQQVDDWRAELDWVRAAGDDGIVIFEEAGRGGEQDDLRAAGFNVVGGSAWGDRLEKERGYGQQVCADIGLQIAASRSFTSLDAAREFIAGYPGRYVLKYDGAGFGAADTYVGQLNDGRDLLAVLAAKLRQRGTEPTRFLLQSRIEGIEMGVGAYFDGSNFVGPPCLDWEHKRFFPGDVGEFTGEMGTVATFDRARRFFDLTLARLAPLLREHAHVGYLNLNTIVNVDGIWPLEFCARFGYPGFAVLEPLQATDWATLLKRLVSGSIASERGGAFTAHSGFSTGVVLTTRPFPFLRHYVDVPIGLPIVFDRDYTAADDAQTHYGEVGLDYGQLVTAGYHGWTMVVTGTGATIAAAQVDAYARVERIVIPNVRYRNDIGDKLVAGDYAAIEALGLLDDAGVADRSPALPHDGVYARLGASRIHGVGVFAIRAIPAGTDIFANDRTGLVWIERAAIAAAGLSDAQLRLYEDFAIRDGSRLGGPATFNTMGVGWHLNQPAAGIAANAAIGGNLSIVAARDIAAGEELTIDYATYSNPGSALLLSPSAGF